MSLGRVLLDTSVFIYFVGVDHPYRDPCRKLIVGLAERKFRGEASVQAIQELVHQRTRRTGDRVAAARVADDFVALCPLHDLTIEDLHLGLRLFREAPRLNSADALHAATALNRGIPTIVSPDPAFDDVTGLQRIDPIEAAALV